jgi:hypothetical protein
LSTIFLQKSVTYEIMISDSDSNIDNQIDNQIDNSIEIKNPIPISIRSIPSIPPIDVLSTNFIEVTNFPLLDGVYSREVETSSSYFYIRLDSAYYFWRSSTTNLWTIFSADTFGGEYTSEDSQSNLILPTTNWYEVSNPENIIPIIITEIS